MVSVLENAGRAFLKVFGPAILVVAIGIAQQPDLNRAVAIGIAGLMAAVASGLAAMQTFVPELTFRHWIGDPAGRYVDAFVHGFVGALLISAIGVLNEPTLHGWGSIVVGIIVGAISAGLQAIEELVSPTPIPPVVPAPAVAARGLRRTVSP